MEEPSWKISNLWSQQNRDERILTLLWFLSFFNEVIVDHLLHLYFKSTDLMTTMQDFLRIKTRSNWHPVDFTFTFVKCDAVKLCTIMRASMAQSVVLSVLLLFKCFGWPKRWTCQKSRLWRGQWRSFLVAAVVGSPAPPPSVCGSTWLSDAAPAEALRTSSGSVVQSWQRFYPSANLRSAV